MQYNVYYRNTRTNRITRYCCSAMPLEMANELKDKFNETYFGKKYPNGKDVYHWSLAWVAAH